ncbi:4Fe-4S dicluster domain-containing protein [Alicyclobacillus cycloheptanicus]|uniref:Glycolate oxidase iron-sulfur subunit n=1 Tax=Alicyclobacillus cycloheptanicus TaxID=1457 RepID=A0ABT9XG02_9BACL|nr:heterodisulfide reductase-related iron-sulfur binding cluster [Alicyclobacillus cycloheptanicus]MDQ0189219.1 glycolate oxidase iron-sulfur subunit [Alicyclobacillus cycloheptanicus]WDM00404.1 4Fe-4S dicluster domain-containing protein [Alicyclobacillus cycloheptanicus]
MQEPNSAFLWPDAPEADKYSVCVHCGFCLEVCPTYQQLGDENHSPRGRVYLIKQAAEGVLPLDESVVDPVFTCLDCRACETVCPSGVQVGALIEEARGQVFHAAPARGWKGLIQRFFLRAVFPKPRRLKLLAGLLRFYQRSGLQRWVRKLRLLAVLPKHLREMEAILPKVPDRRAIDALPPEIPATGSTDKGVAGLFTGCVMDVFFADVNQATARVAARNGWRVRVPKDQLCCGALQVHAGDRDMARQMARRNIDVFLASGADRIIINAAGCGAALKEYPALFRDDPVYREKAEQFSARVRDISELLVESGFEPPQGEVPRTIAYHDACHLCHAQQVRTQPRTLLGAIPGLCLVEMADSDRCCGSAGIYNLTHPEMAGALLERKMDDLPDGIDGVAMGNPGCMMQLMVGAHRRQADVEILHTVELLDLAYQREEVGTR